MTVAPFLSRLLRVSDVPPEGTVMDIEADAAERAALARQNGVLEIARLGAALTVKPLGGNGLRVGGTVSAEFRQTCVITLEPFDSRLSEEIDVRFVPKGAKLPISRDGEDVSDEIVNGLVDLGALVAEFFALGLDPYPRKPGASFAGYAEDDDARPASPFAGLKNAFPGKGEVGDL